MAFYKVCGNYYGTDNDANSLKHYRTPGSKNGVRKYQYEDGTLTPAGKIHYGIGKGNTGSINLPKGSQTPLNRTAMANYRGHAGMPYSIRRSPNYYAEEEATLPNRRLEADGAGSKRMHGPGRVAQKSYNNIAIDPRETGLTPKGTELGPKGGSVGTWRAETKTPYQDSVSGVIDRHPESRARLGLRDPVSNVISNNLQRDVRRPSGVAGNIYDAKNWVGDRASDVRDWGEQAGRDVGNAVNEAKRWVGDRASDAKELGSKAVSDAKNWTDKNVTGGSAKNDYELNMARATVSSRNSDYGMSRENPNMNRKAAQRSEDTERTYRDNAAEAKRTYDDSLAGKAEKAVSDVKKAGDKAGSWIGDRAKEAGNTISKTASDVGKAAKNAGDWVGDRAKDVGKAASKAAKDVSNWGSGAVSKGRDFITGLFGKKKK